MQDLVVWIFKRGGGGSSLLLVDMHRTNDAVHSEQPAGYKRYNYDPGSSSKPSRSKVHRYTAAQNAEFDHHLFRAKIKIRKLAAESDELKLGSYMCIDFTKRGIKGWCTLFASSVGRHQQEGK